MEQMLCRITVSLTINARSEMHMLGKRREEQSSTPLLRLRASRTGVHPFGLLLSRLVFGEFPQTVICVVVVNTMFCMVRIGTTSTHASDEKVENDEIKVSEQG